MSCLFCDVSRGRLAPPSDALHREGGILFCGSLDPRLVAGWMVLAPERHVENWDELPAEEASALGDLIRRGVAAVRKITGAPKVYVASFAEAVPHLHVHLFPREADIPVDARGPRFLFDGAPRAGAVAFTDTAKAIVEWLAHGGEEASA